MKKINCFFCFLLLITSLQAQNSISLNDSKPLPFYLNKTENKLAKTNLSESKSFFVDDYATGHPGAAELKMPAVAFPSPNAASLIRTVNENVDLYTGKLNVSIPIYTIKSRNVEIPITLNGSASAHRVNEIASWVGLGWHLNAGGAITRVMNNLPDEFTGTISSTFNILGYGFTKVKAGLGINLVHFLDINNTYYSTEQKKDIINRGAWNNTSNMPQAAADLQPDQFYFNFGKYSGRFVFDQDGNVQLLAKANLKIVPSYQVINGNNKIVSFIVLTDDGYKYEFGNFALNAVEETKIVQSSKSLPLYFDNVNYQNGIGYRYNTKPAMLSIKDNNNNGGYDNFERQQNNEYIEYCTYPSAWYLTKVTSPTDDFINLIYKNNGTLNYMSDRSFSASTIDFSRRTPESQGYNLSVFGHVDIGIGIPNYYPSPCLFTVSYSNSIVSSKRLEKIVTAQGYTAKFIASQPRYDLPGDKALDEIVIENSGVLIKTFRFVYFDSYSDEEIETFKFGYLKHRWIDPPSTDALEPTSELRQFNIDDCNRHRLFLKYIKEIGGEFYLNESLPPYEFFYDLDIKLPYRSSTKQDLYGFANNNTTRYPFADVQYQVAEWYNPNTGFTCNSEPNCSRKPILFFQMTGSSGNAIQWPAWNEMGTKDYSFTQMKAGTLKKIILPTGGIKEYEYEYSGSTQYKSWNGLRIKKISERESANATANETHYSYGDFKFSDFAITNYRMKERVYNNEFYDNRVFFNSNRINPQTLTKGSEGGYDFVEVSKTGNGKYRADFTTVIDHENLINRTIRITSLFTTDPPDWGYYKHPFPANTSFEWKQGLPKKETYTNENGNRIKEVFYEYDFTSWQSNSTKVVGLQVSKYRFNTENSSYNFLLYGATSYTSEWNALKSKTERAFASDGINYSEQKTEIYNSFFVNDGLQYLMPTEVKTSSTSKNEKVVQNYTYAINYSAPFQTDDFTGGLSLLKSKHILSAPIEQTTRLETINGGVIKYIGGTINQYHSNKPLLKKIFDLQPTSTLTTLNLSTINNGYFTFNPNYKPVINYTMYDIYGNILERNEESDLKESYIWGYNQTFPVAKIINAAANDVGYTSFEADGTGYFNGINTQGIQNNGVTGKKSYLINASPISLSYLDPNKKYIASIWAKNGTPISTQYTLGGGVVPGQDFVAKASINGWTYYEKEFTGAFSITISGSVPEVLIDEVRIHPKNAQMTTYTFEPMVGMTSQCDMNNRTVYYEYDSFQRLKLIRDQFGNVTKTFEYNYKLF